MNALQGRCSLCRYKATWCCSKCEYHESLGNTMFLCNPKSKRTCFATHVKTYTLLMSTFDLNRILIAFMSCFGIEIDASKNKNACH